jgi:two-component system sensor histidine kinase HydH
LQHGSPLGDGAHRAVIKRMSEKRRWIIAIGIMVLGISILHYLTSARLEADQVVYAKLYYVPVTVAALIFGLRGGLLAAALIAAIYGPSLAFQKSGPRALLLDFSLDLVLLFAVGLLVGLIVGRQREHQRRAREAERLASLGRAAAMMAHEMKSPLVAIGGFARMLLRESGLDKDSEEKLEVIKVESARLERLVHDALDFARFQPVHIERVRVDDLLARTLEVVRAVAATKDVRLVETIDSPDLEVDCDPGRIVQVLINLLDNAIHYTPRGGDVHLSITSTSAGTIRVEIRDSGRGIPDDMLGHLFEPFAGRREGGSGLGLAISQRIVIAHGGRIEAENLSEGGALFRFDLPLAGRNLEPPEGTV